MNTSESTSCHSKSTLNDDEDEELAQLRLAALLSRKSAKPNKQSTNEDSIPQSSFIQTQTGTSRKFWSNRRRVPCLQKPNHRSNLIVINPVALEQSSKGNETESYPKLVLPQHRWCNSSNEDSMSPKSSNFKKKDPSRFSRFESDSDSESDFDIPSSSSENSDSETPEKICDTQNPDCENQDAVSSSFDVPSSPLRENASTVAIVDSKVLCNHVANETVAASEKVSTSDSHSASVSESSAEETVDTCQSNKQKDTLVCERDSPLEESANVVDLHLTSEMPTDLVLSEPIIEFNSEDDVLVNKVCSSTEIVSKELNFLPCEAQGPPGVVESGVDPVTEKQEYNDPELRNGSELCNSEHLTVPGCDLNCNNETEQTLSKNDLRHELKKRKQKRDRRYRNDRYSEYTSSSENDSSSESSYSDHRSRCSASLDSLSGSDQGSSDESLSPPVKSVLSVVKPISLENSDLHHSFSGKNFHETAVSHLSKGQKDQKCSPKVEYHSSIEDICNFHPQSSKKRRSSSSSVEKDYKKSTEDHFTDEVPDGWCKKRLPVHMRLGVPAKRRFADVDESGQYSRHSKFSNKYSTNDPKKTNFRIEVSDSFGTESNANNSWRKERSVKDDTHKKRKVTW